MTSILAFALPVVVVIATLEGSNSFAHRHHHRDSQPSRQLRS
jgi:hypothetical protein